MISGRVGRVSDRTLGSHCCASWGYPRSPDKSRHRRVYQGHTALSPDRGRIKASICPRSARSYTPSARGLTITATPLTEHALARPRLQGGWHSRTDSPSIAHRPQRRRVLSCPLQLRQQPEERTLFGRIESACDNKPLARMERRQKLIDDLSRCRGDLDETLAAIVGMVEPPNEPAFSSVSSSGVMLAVVINRRCAITVGSSGSPAPSTTARTSRALRESW